MNASRRRKQVIEATVDSIAKYGLNATTLATVANEAGLSQGVAVFYFKTKEALLTETLRYLHQEYKDLWLSALEKCGDDPLERIMSLVSSDFAPAICGRKKLAIWFAFWGAAKARPMYAKISSEFDTVRIAAMHELCQALKEEMPPAYNAQLVAVTIDALSDGCWLRMHLFPREFDRHQGQLLMFNFLLESFPHRKTQIEAFIEKKSLRKKSVNP